MPWSMLPAIPAPSTNPWVGSPPNLIQETQPHQLLEGLPSWRVPPFARRCVPNDRCRGPIELKRGAWLKVLEEEG